MELNNPYLKEYAQLPDEKPMFMMERPSKKRYDSSNGQFKDNRSDLVVKYAWAVPTCEVIHKLSINHRKIVEIGAGTGYWGYLLKQAGVEVVCFDKHPPSLRNLNDYRHNKCYIPIRKGNHKVLPMFTDHTLMLCWPPYSNPMAVNCLRAYKGERLIYIGEGDGGCTASEEFFEELSRYWELVEEFDIPQWDGIHDSVQEYVRTK